jgi:hypothetical protein
MCVRCGKRIGVYEPLLILRPDRAARRSCYLELRDEPGDSLGGCELAHATCLPVALPRPRSAGVGV